MREEGKGWSSGESVGGERHEGRGKRVVEGER